MNASRLLPLLFVVTLFACSDSKSAPTASEGPATPDVSTMEPEVDLPPSSAITARVLFRDIETGSLWNLRGEAIAGELSGAHLTQSDEAFSAYWFAWASFWPSTSVWGEEETDGLLPAGSFDLIDTREFIPDLPRDAIPPLEAPRDRFGEVLFVAPEAAGMRGGEIVVGLAIDGEARAYPLRILNFHEIALHELAGHQVMVTYCPLTGSGIVFDPGSDWFGNSGGLFNNNMVMYDRSTQSLWSQMRLSPIIGERLGELIPRLPVYQGTWDAWLELFPETLVLSTQTGYTNRNYAGDIYIERGYTTSEDIYFFQGPPIDRRFPAKDPVLGFVSAESARAYPLSRLQERLGSKGVVNDQFGDGPILVIYDGPGRMAVGFSRNVDGRVLTFERQEG